MSELSSSNEWSTPQKLFDRLNAEWEFNVDAAAAPWNAKCPVYWTKRMNALNRRWYGRVWLNPPYGKGQLPRWMAKARRETLAGRVEAIGCLVPAYTSETWWQENVLAPVDAGRVVLAGYDQSDTDAARGEATSWVWWERLWVRWTFLRGRVSFREKSGKTGSARFSSAFVVFEPPR